MGVVVDMPQETSAASSLAMSRVTHEVYFRLDNIFLGKQGTRPNFVSTIRLCPLGTPGRDPTTALENGQDTRHRVITGTRTARARVRLGVVDREHAFAVRYGQDGLVHLRALHADSLRLSTPARTRTWAEPH